MKRCPQCLFLFPESDEICDFDQTPLEVVDDAEFDAGKSPPKRVRAKGKALPIAAAIGLILGLVVFGIYYGVGRQTQPNTVAAPSPEPMEAAVPLQSETVLPSPSPSPTPSPSPSPKSTSKEISTSHSRATTDPVSTSGPGMATRQGGKPVIVLTSGGRIEADEVWRTRDGIWYRRNGIVTLLKRGQVKAVVTR